MTSNPDYTRHGHILRFCTNSILTQGKHSDALHETNSTFPYFPTSQQVDDERFQANYSFWQPSA